MKIKHYEKKPHMEKSNTIATDLKAQIEKTLGTVTIETVGVISEISFTLGCVEVVGDIIGFVPTKDVTISLEEIAAIQLVMLNICHFRNL